MKTKEKEKERERERERKRIIKLLTYIKLLGQSKRLLVIGFSHIQSAHG